METKISPVTHENYRSRHLPNTRWCPVTFVLVEAGSAVNWSITRKQGAMRIKWGTLLETSTKKPKHCPHQKPASTRCGSDQHWNNGDLSWRSRPLDRGTERLFKIAYFGRIWLSLSTPIGTFSWPDLTSLSAFATKHKDIAKTWRHINGEIELYVIKRTFKVIHEASFPGSSLQHLIFRRRPTNFNFRSKPFSKNFPGTLRTISTLFRWIIHWNTTTSWCHLQDIVRTDITSLKRII